MVWGQQGNIVNLWHPCFELGEDGQERKNNIAKQTTTMTKNSIMMLRSPFYLCLLNSIQDTVMLRGDPVTGLSITASF